MLVDSVRAMRTLYHAHERILSIPAEIKHFQFVRELLQHLENWPKGSCLKAINGLLLFQWH